MVVYLVVTTNPQQQKQKQRDTRKLLKVMNMFIIWFAVTVTQMSTYVQTHQVVYANFVHLFFCLPIVPIIRLGEWGAYFSCRIDVKIQHVSCPQSRFPEEDFYQPLSQTRTQARNGEAITSDSFGRPVVLEPRCAGSRF